MILVEERNAEEAYISFQGDSKTDYANFSAKLNDIQDKTFDTDAGKWCCSRVEARRIADTINNPGVGDDLKLKPYGYQRQAIAFCVDHGYGIVRLPCGAGRVRYC